jgi:DNA-binding CsgD family transcriptional regulator
MSTPTPAPGPASIVPTTFSKYDLTGREVQMLELVSRNQTNAAIAKIFSTTEQVVKNRFRRVFRRMKVGNRAAAVAKALREGTIR